MAKNKKNICSGCRYYFIPKQERGFYFLTDIARHKDAEHTDSIIQNWMRNRNTIELLGFWETIYNPNFKPLEFDGFKKLAGLNSFVIRVNPCNSWQKTFEL